MGKVLEKNTKIRIYQEDNNDILCEVLPSIEFVDRLTFYNCESVKTIDIHSFVSIIHNRAFERCKSLQCINVSLYNSNYFSFDGVLFDKNSRELICYPSGKLSSEYDIPNDVKSIGCSAFYRCSQLKNIYIPKNVNAVVGSAFNRCTSLQSIYVDTDNSLYSSVDGVLFSKNMDTLIKFPIGKSMKKYQIPSTVTSFELDAFWDCTSLESIDIPSTITSVNCAFSRCSSLICVNLPDSITSIRFDAFKDCSSLKHIRIPSSVTSIGESAFCRCSALESFNIPSSVTNIENSAFRDCISLKTIVIPDSINFISEYTFWGCISLYSVVIPKTINRINVCAFSGCISLECIDIPASVTTIGNGAFGNCVSLRCIRLHYLNIEKCNIEFDAFCGINFDKCVLYVPSGTRWSYRHHSVFGRFKNIVTEKHEENEEQMFVV